MPSNDSIVDEAKKLVRKIHGNTSVSQSQTKEDLEMVAEEIEALIDSLDDVDEDEDDDDEDDDGLNGCDDDDDEDDDI